MSSTPLCPVFGACGGCAYQDLPYEEELRIKERKLKELLKAECRMGEEIFEPIVASPKSYHYRNRLDLEMRRSQGRIVMGFQSAALQRVIPVESCAIAMPEISDFIPSLRTGASTKLPADYRTANLVVRTGDDGRVVWGGIGRRSLEMKKEDYLWTEIEGRRIFYSLETFFQANLSILPHVIQKIRSLVSLDRDTLFLDLYSGAGLFGLCFADQVRRVVMIEECPGSIKLAQHNVRYHELTQVEIRRGRVEEELPRLELSDFKKTVAIVDPPRQGLSGRALEVLTEANYLQSLLYLSCHPESLARDLAQFLEKGWQVEKVVPFDFFPKTQHIETLVLLGPFPTGTGLGLSMRPVPVGNGPIELEIGCGKGKFLIGRAQESPERNFIGIDRVGKWMKIGEARGQKRNLKNLVFIKTEAREFLKSLAPASLNAVHLYFPDPWPKRRHRRRRLFTPDFLALIHAALKPSGLLEIATDDEDYFRQILKTVAEAPLVWDSRCESVNARLRHPHLKTNYELKFEATGRKLYYLELKK